MQGPNTIIHINCLCVITFLPSFLGVDYPLANKRVLGPLSSIKDWIKLYLYYNSVYHSTVTYDIPMIVYKLFEQLDPFAVSRKPYPC